MGWCGAGDTEGDFVEAGDAVFGDVFELGGVLVELVRELEGGGGGGLTPQQFMEKTRIVGGSVGEAIVVGCGGGGVWGLVEWGEW